MNKVDIIRKHIGNDNFYDMNGTSMLTNVLNAMEEYKEQEVKNCSIPDVVESAFSFDDLEVFGSNSGETGIVFNVPEAGRESVCLKHIPTGKIGYVELNT